MGRHRRPIDHPAVAPIASTTTRRGEAAGERFLPCTQHELIAPLIHRVFFIIRFLVSPLPH